MKISERQSLVILLLLCLIGVGLSRAPWLGREMWNLDEGSTFTMAHQVMDGDVLYRDAADNRSPLVPYLKAAVFTVFGQWNAHAVHLVLTLMIGITVFGLGWIGYRLGGMKLAWPTAVSAWFLQIYWIDVGDAMSANTEWFVIAFSTAAFALFIASLEAARPHRGLLVGLLFGGAMLCKQPGLLDMLVAGILIGLLAWRSPLPRRSQLLRFGATMAVGTLLPLGAFSLHYAIVGAWDDYIYYAFTFNTEVYIPEVPFWERMACVQKPFSMALLNAPLFGLLGIVGAVMLLCRALPQLRRKEPIELLPWLILGWTASGLVSTTLSGRDFAHYSEQIIPGLSLAIGWVYSRLDSGAKAPWNRWVRNGLIVALIVSVGVRNVQIKREIDATDGQPHPLGLLAREFSDPEETVFVWGYFPEIYFFAQRAPATRFIYTNYLTGLIAWTNLDPFADVSNGISPGAQEKFEADFSERLPSVIVDTGVLRGYAKFPIEQRAWLWPQITAHYAEVAAATTPPHRMRLLRRLQPVTKSAPPLPSLADLPLGLRIKGHADLRAGSEPMIRVEGDSGVRRLLFLVDGEPQHELRYVPALPVAVGFWGNNPFAMTNVEVLAERIDGTWVRSASFDFASFVRDHNLRKPVRPALRFERTDIAPTAVASYHPEVTSFEAHDDIWNIVAPGQLRYPVPAGVRQLKFAHGISPSVMFYSDGYDISLYQVNEDNVESLLWRRRMEPRLRGSDQHLQFENIELPEYIKGDLEVRFTTGAFGDANNDHVLFGQLEGLTRGPNLFVGGKPLPAIDPGGTAYSRSGDGFWLLHAPSRISWTRPDNLMEFSFTYGMDPGSYDSGDQGHSSGMGFNVFIEKADGTTLPLWNRILRPFNHVEDRGEHRVTIALPPAEDGILMLTTDGGDDEDTTWDWGFAGDFSGITPGPPILLSDDTKLLSIANAGFNQGWSDRQSEDHWGAQTPQELTYDKPSALSSVTIRYGISPQAARDENGQRRSDGVRVRVFFRAEDGKESELFQRILDPFNRPEDAGEHVTTLSTQPGRAGTLHVCMEPGPYGDNSFDWAFWGRFEGELAP